MADKHWVVIGNGPAGKSAAATLREKDEEARITIISREACSTYRPALLPELIAGRIPEKEIYAAAFDYYEDLGVQLRTGQQVVDLDLTANRLYLDHKEIINYSGLIICVGGKPRIPEPLQIFTPLFMTLKTIEDARSWSEKLAGAETVLIIGGDLTSLSLTRSLLTMGKKVGFVLDEQAFWPMRCNPGILEASTRALEAKGVEVIQGPIKTVSRAGDGYEVESAEGRFRADLIGAFFGLVPDVSWLVGTGLRIERGILVDQYLRTEFEGVYAAGDCAQVFHPELRDYWVSIGIENAATLGRIAAANLAGEDLTAKVEPEDIFCDNGVRANTSWWTEF